MDATHLRASTRSLLRATATASNTTSVCPSSSSLPCLLALTVVHSSSAISTISSASRSARSCLARAYISDRDESAWMNSSMAVYEKPCSLQKPFRCPPAHMYAMNSSSAPSRANHSLWSAALVFGLLVGLRAGFLLLAVAALPALVVVVTSGACASCALLITPKAHQDF
ncbi:hypothetical protein D3C72_1382700 [compost metagenome]